MIIRHEKDSYLGHGQRKLSSSSDMRTKCTFIDGMRPILSIQGVSIRCTQAQNTTSSFIVVDDYAKESTKVFSDYIQIIYRDYI